MIAEAAKFRGFDVERLYRLSRLLGGAPGEGPVGPPGVVILRRGGQVVLAYHTHRGRLEPGALEGASLEERASAQGARWAVEAEVEAIEVIHEAASRGLRVGQDTTELLLLGLRAADEAKSAGRLVLYPDLFEGIKPPSRSALDRVFDVILPPRTSALFYIFDRAGLYAEAIIARGPRELRLIGGHQVLEAGPPPGRRWREDYKGLLKAAEGSVGAPTLGVFVSLETAKALLRGDPAFDLSRAIARKDLILDPLPLWLAGPLGVAAVRNVVEVGRKATEALAERVRPKGFAGRLAGRMAGKVAGRVRSAVEESIRSNLPIERVEQTVEGLRKRADLAEILGFDPFLIGRRFSALMRSS